MRMTNKVKGQIEEIYKRGGRMVDAVEETGANTMKEIERVQKYYKGIEENHRQEMIKKLEKVEGIKKDFPGYKEADRQQIEQIYEIIEDGYRRSDIQPPWEIEDGKQEMNEDKKEEIEMTNKVEMKRANRVAVQKDEDGYMARFYKTHTKVAEIHSTDTEWKSNEKVNSTANRELYRAWIVDNADQYGIQYDPKDRRTNDNKVPNKYESDEMLMEWSRKIIEDDIQTWVDKMGIDGLTIESIAPEEIQEVIKSARGKDVKPKYKNGNWAWAKIPVTITVVDADDNETYPMTVVELVSGQLKKPSAIGNGGYNYTGLMEEIKIDLPHLFVKDTEDQSEESAK